MSDELEEIDEYDEDLECGGGESEEIGDDGGELAGDVDRTRDVVAIA